MQGTQSLDEEGEDVGHSTGPFGQTTGVQVLGLYGVPDGVFFIQV